MIRTLGLIPLKEGYTAQAGEDYLRTSMDGPAGNYRFDLINAAVTLTCRFRCTREGYRYIRAFYRTATQHGALPFYIRMIWPLPTLTTHKAAFVPGTIQLQEHNGRKYTVSAQILVEPIQQ